MERAWVYVALANEEELAAEDHLVVTDIRAGESHLNLGSGHSMSRPGGTWVLRSHFSGKIGRAVTGGSSFWDRCH